MNSHGDYGVPRVKKNSGTIAHSPNFTKPRPHVIREVRQEPARLRSHPYVPSKPYVPKIEHRQILPVDFKLPGDAISEQKRLKYLEQVKKEEEERKFVFKAQPVVTNLPTNVSVHL